jgi:predicted nucleotidyltransferase
MDTNSQGLRNNDIAEIIEVLVKYPEVKRAYIFGSRAKGNYRYNSDVDIALEGEEVTNKVAWDIKYSLLVDCWMPYNFDVLALSTLKNEKLKEEIEAVKKLIYAAP